MTDISIVHARMEELESEVAEQREALEAHLAECKNKMTEYYRPTVHRRPLTEAELRTYAHFGVNDTAERCTWKAYLGYTVSDLRWTRVGEDGKTLYCSTMREIVDG